MSDSHNTSAQTHQKQARELVQSRPVQCAVLTVSDTRSLQTDTGGPLIEKHLTEAGHRCVARAIVKDDPAQISQQIQNWLADTAIHAILITGGTGIARRDTTIEVVRRFLTVELEGFGELFRMISYSQVKGAAMLSRAVGGLVVRHKVDHASSNATDTFIFAMPGSPNAVETAMANLIAPQLAHLVWERTR